MRFDEAVVCLTVGDMVPNEMLTNPPSHETATCYTCNCRLSRYNPSKRCFPCRETERKTNEKAIEEIFGGIID